MRKKALICIVALVAALAIGLGIASASPSGQVTRPLDSFEILIGALTDAHDKGLLSDSGSEALSDWFVENKISVGAGETPRRTRQRLSEPGQTKFEFLIAALRDTHHRNLLPDTMSETLSDWFVENVIAPHTGETREQVIARLKAVPRPTPTPIPVDDRAALTALYNATAGANWKNNANWLSHSPIGEWHGVTTDADGRVAKLELTENRLRGRIPPELGNLTRLTELSLDNHTEKVATGTPTPTPYDINELKGHIPRELGNLANLKKLNLAHNRLNGMIPVELSKLRNLEDLTLKDNYLWGRIPPEFISLTNLKFLILSNNQLSGHIPPELGDLKKLEWLHLAGNRWEGCIPRSLEAVPSRDFPDDDDPDWDFCDP